MEVEVEGKLEREVAWIANETGKWNWKSCLVSACCDVLFVFV